MFKVEVEQDRGDWGILSATLQFETRSESEAIKLAWDMFNAPIRILSVKPADPTVPTYRYDIGNVPVYREGYRNGDLDDPYWSNKFAQVEREIEAHQELLGMVLGE